MKEYNQLSLENRHQIKALLEAGHNQSEIARTIDVHRSTICRELQRNVAKSGSKANVYLPDQAHGKTTKRHRNKPKYQRFSDFLKAQARQWLRKEKISPELISGRWTKKGIKGVSHATIYRWIWKAKRAGNPQDSDLYKQLKHGKRKRRNYQDSRGRIKGRVSINKRPADIEKRKRLGDIEVDLMMGKAHKSALLVLVDRSTLLTMLEKVTSRKSDLIARRITDRLAGIPAAFTKTLTFDNDKAFARHEHTAETLYVDCYFTRAYTSQDKGTVENRIGTIRRFFPKGTDLRNISEQRIKEVQKYLNFRPVRKFNYLNPIQQTLKHRAAAVTLMS